MRRARSIARSLTSTAHTSASGDSSPKVSAIGPQPQPRPRKVPDAGGAGACRNNTVVPWSMRSGEKMPGATCTVRVAPANGTWMVRRSSALAGSAVK